MKIQNCWRQKMKLTNRTTPQARNYQCDKCKSIFTHKQMYNDNLCEDCYTDKVEEIENE